MTTTGVLAWSVDLPAASTFMATHARVLDRRRFELLNGAETPPVCWLLSTATATETAATDGASSPTYGRPRANRPPRTTRSSCSRRSRRRRTRTPSRCAIGSSRSRSRTAVCRSDYHCASRLAQGRGGSDPIRLALRCRSPRSRQRRRTASPSTTRRSQPIRGWNARPHTARGSSPRSTPRHSHTCWRFDQLLDTVYDVRAQAPELLHKLGAHVPLDGHLAVTGGSEGEMLTPLHLAPYPDRPARELINPDVIAADLERLAAAQRDDGGWTVDYLQISPAGVLDWRGYSTVRAIKILRSNGGISPDRASRTPATSGVTQADGR